MQLKTWKLVSGIISVVLCLFVGLQSCAAGIGNTLEGNGQISGSAGFVVVFMLLAGGIISIVTRKSNSKGANVALVILFGIGALFGYTLAGNFGDLMIWDTWCLVCAVLAIVSIVKGRKDHI